MFAMDNNSSQPFTASPQEVPGVSSLACDIVLTMEDSFLFPSTSSPQDVPDVSSLACDSVVTTEDNFLLPSTSPQEVPDNKIQQTARPKSSKRKDRKKKGDNTTKEPYERVKRSKIKKLKGLPLDKADQLRLKIKEQERNRKRVKREALDELKQMDIPDFLSVDNYEVGSKCHTLKTTIAYIAHMMSQIDNYDQIHGVSEHLQQQAQMHQQWLQEKLNVMQQEEAKYQQLLQELEQEIILHQQQQFLQPTTNVQLQCDSQLQQLQLDQQQTFIDQPQIQLQTQQILPNLQQPQILFNPHHHQLQSISQLYHQQLATTVDQQTTLPENYQQKIPPCTMFQPLQSQLQQHISPQYYPQQPDVQLSYPVPLHHLQTHQEQSLLPLNNPSDFPSDPSAPTTSFTPMNSILFNHAPQFVDSNGHFNSMYQSPYQDWEVNSFQQPVFALQYYPAPMSWAPHRQPFGLVSDVILMNQGQS